MTEETQYDVFLSHNSQDKPAVELLARRLIDEAGLRPFLDKWHLIPGDLWQEALEEALDQSRTCAVFIGPSGTGPWQNEEMRAAINRRVSESGGRFRVIPVLLPGAERGERSRLPTFLIATTWVEFRRTLDDEDAFHRLVCGIRGIAPGPGPGQAIYEGECPYRGLQVFHVQHAPFFFGREALIGWLLNELRPSTDPSQDNRFLGIIGPSGSGKSSLARAGLLAALKQGEIEDSAAWPIAICRPGADPLESLAVALSDATGIGQSPSALRDLIQDLRDDERMLHLTARLALHDASPKQRLVLLVDQFEELFTLCHDEGFHQALIDNLLYAASVIGGQTVVLLTLRADFYGKCAVHPALAAALSDHPVLVGPMAEEELRRAIERPAQLAGCEFEPGLVELLLNDVREQPGGLPLLQHALLELWGRREGWRLTHAAYQAIGGVEGALERRAEEVYNRFGELEREVCRRVFLRLTQPGEGTEDTKRRASLQELRPTEGEQEKLEAVVRTLTDARLLTTEGGEALAGEQFVEVAHVALIRGWPRLQEWIERDREALRIHRRLTEAALEWERHGRDESYLYRGARLAEAEEWRSGHEDELNQLERGFLDASKVQQQREMHAARELERLKQEARLRQGETALGRLTRDIAHHVKNQVGIIRLSALALLNDLDDHELGLSPSRVKTLERILRNAEAAIELSNTLFQPFIQNPPEWCDVNLLLQESMNLVGEQANVDIRLALSTGLLEIYVEPQGTINVFQELIINALKAIEKREPPRQIEITTRLAPDAWVEVLFSNNGPPIPKDQWELIFEQFTVGKRKDRSEGFGLGLWSARVFIRRQGGEIYLLDSNDTKTTFVIRLPTSQNEVRESGIK